MEINLDFRMLIAFLKIQKFRMVRLAAIIPSLESGDWFVALDLQDVYFPIMIHPSHKRFLWFVVGQDIQY